MSPRKSPSALLPLVALAIGACGPPAARQTSEAGALPQENRTLVVATRVEPQFVAPGINVGGSTVQSARALFAASLTYTDERDVAQPRLALALPQLNTDTWRLFPDGRMETTWRLRSSLTWHDGTPLTAEDFAFGHRVRMTPGVGLFVQQLADRIKEEVVALDPLTVLVRWSTPYPEADGAGDLHPLPRHILEQPYRELPAESFGNLPYWNREYVGLGPYRLVQWEPGAFIEGAAFPGYVLGRPKIDRVVLRWIADPNAAVANLLSDEVHAAADDALRFQAGMTLQREWAPRNGGQVLLNPNQTRYIQIQHRPEYATPRAILDRRGRQAVAHAVDRDGLADALFEGQGQAAHVLISPLLEYFAEADRAVTRYSYDLRRTEQLMAEAGLTKGPDGFYTSPTEGRFNPDLRAAAGGQEEQETTIIHDQWRQAGIDARLELMPPAQMQVGEIRDTFRSFQTAVTGNTPDTPLVKFLTERISGPENRWVGSNRGGYRNPEYDGLYALYSTSLDRAERNRAVTEMVKIVNADVSGIPLYYNFSVLAHAAGLRGPVAGRGLGNIHEWEFVRL